MYYAPLLCTFGILGNSLSLLVFCMDYNYRQQSSSYYLCALALSDSAYLLNYFRIWMINHLEVGLPANNFTCKLETYLFQVIRFTSGYITVTFSLERYIAIQYPFSRPRICTRSNAKKAIAVVASTAMLFFSYTWLISELVLIPVKGENCNQTNLTTCDNITYGICSYPDHYHRISEMVTYVDSVVTVLIPFVLITYFNGRIAAIVLQMNRDRKKILASANTSAVATAGPNNRTSTVTMHSLNARVHQSQTGIEMMQSGIQTAHNPSNDRLEQAPVTYHQRQQPQSSDVRVTKALLLVSTVFLVLTLPAHAIRGIRFILEVKWSIYIFVIVFKVQSGVLLFYYSIFCFVVAFTRELVRFNGNQ